MAIAAVLVPMRRWLVTDSRRVARDHDHDCGGCAVQCTVAGHSIIQASRLHVE